ncbi:DUF6580 family putative transport protein [Pedobacter sp. KR3-3]|uniref:DUF6580 family putative transport protein n=1 Tax=Pedobacter albus TaxID=3113905 RepID=A0ABU7I4T9_9SPHI|nr:DUF6580 family putative transport protein [Pedobacter sp. KR3-3]MEE1944351.1 DUF6580 family putative transport protein [Pedobacter sp. KR3-3]
MENKFNSRTLVLLLFMVVIIGLRVIAPLSPDFKVIANFSAIGAVALFGGAYFKNTFNAFALPMLVLLLSDIGLAQVMGKDYGFYQGWYYTYIAFALMVLVGRVLIKKVNIQNLFVASLAVVFIHWIVSDFGVWLGSTTYPQTLAGFWACLVAAIPFELNFLYGTLAYTALMFGVFESLKAKYPVLSLKRDIVHS